jgi:hypothetical protein
MEIAAAKVPDAYLQSLHPQHEQFVRPPTGTPEDAQRSCSRTRQISDGSLVNMERLAVDA